MAADLFLLQQRQSISQQSHPEAPGGDLGRHEGEEQLRRLPEALLSVQLVELTVLPCKIQTVTLVQFLFSTQLMLMCNQ